MLRNILFRYCLFIVLLFSSLNGYCAPKVGENQKISADDCQSWKIRDFIIDAQSHKYPNNDYNWTSLKKNYAEVSLNVEPNAPNSFSRGGDAVLGITLPVWDFHGWTLDQVSDWPVTVMIEFTYTIKADKTVNTGDALSSITAGSWTDKVKIENIGSRHLSKNQTISLPIITTFGKLITDIYRFEAFCAIAASNTPLPDTLTASAQIEVIGISVKFDDNYTPPGFKRPTAIFNVSSAKYEPNQEVIFNASDSYDSDGNIVSYHWDFGDGTFAEGRKVSHSYLRTGSYIAALIVTDNTSLTGTSSAIVKIAYPLKPQVPADKITKVAEPINVASGAMDTSAVDFSIPAGQFPLVLKRHYNSQDDFLGAFGYGWRTDYDDRLSFLPSGEIKQVDAEGVVTYYLPLEDGTYQLPIGKFQRLSKNIDNTYTVEYKHGISRTFDITGKLIEISGRNNNRLRIRYNNNGFIEKVFDDFGRELSFFSDINGRVFEVIAPQGKTFKYGYDINGNLESALSPDNNQTRYEYDNNHNLTKIVDSQNHSLNFIYDDFDRAVSSWSEDRAGKTDLDYSDSTATKVTDSLGNQTTYEFNSYGLVEAVTNPKNSRRKIVWDAQMNRVDIFDENNHHAHFDYDNAGNCIGITDALNHTAVFNYTSEPYFFLSSIIDSLNHKTEYFYDSRGNLIKAVNPLNEEINYEYDAYGNVLAIIDANNNRTEFLYDSYNNLQKVIDSNSNQTQFTYDLSGNLLTNKNAAGNIMSYAYDKLNRLIEITYPDNSHINYTYDTINNKTAIIDQLGRITKFTYDSNYRLKSETNPLGAVIAYEYDSEGNKLAVSDPLGNINKYTYDALNRLNTAISPSNETTSYEYDFAGNISAVIDPSNNRIRYFYDETDKLSRILYPDNSEITYEYDSAGRVIKIEDITGKIEYAYDAVDRIIQVDTAKTGMPVSTVKYEYDHNGNRIKLVYPDNTFIVYDYDNLNRLKCVRSQSGETIVSYQYDSISRRINLTYANNNQIDYKYDSLNRLIGLRNKTAGSQIFSINKNLAYVYDLAGRKIKTIYDDNTYTRYVYDQAGQLIEEAVRKPSGRDINKTEYIYDFAGNRRQVKTIERIVGIDSAVKLIRGQLQQSNTNIRTTIIDYFCDSENQIIQTKETQTTQGIAGSQKIIDYDYDHNGNMITQTEFGSQINYAYDYRNRLINITQPNTPDIQYTYDPLNRRIEKTPDNIHKTSYIYDGDDIIEEFIDNDKSTRYVHGLGIDEPITVTSYLPSPQTYFYHLDGLGSVNYLSGSSGTIVETRNHTAYGLSKIFNIKTTNNKYGFTAREYDQDTGLYYYRNRYYSPSLGRFISKDPLGTIDGPNIYRYCFNNPISYTDPWGLCGGRENWPNEPGIEEDFLFTDVFFDGIDLVNLYSDPESSIIEKISWTPIVIGPITTAAIRKGKKVVIGETGKRVAEKAIRIGAEYYRPIKEVSEIGIKKAMLNNYQWLMRKVKQGYKIIDIGLDRNRKGGRGIFYEAEKQWLRLWEK